MFQPNYNIRHNNMNFVNSDTQLLNMYQRSLTGMPRETQYRNNVPQHIDANITRRTHTFLPPLMQPPSRVSRFNAPHNLAESSRLQARNTVSPGPGHPVPSTSVNVNSSIVNMNTSTNSITRGDISDVPSVTRVTEVQQENAPPITTINNSLLRRNSVQSSATNASSMDQSLSSTNATSQNLNVRLFGSTENEKFFVFTGTVERVIAWNKIFRNHFCFYEVIAAMISIQEGTMRTQKIMLLRDKKGPILQVVYYNITTHMDIENFHVDQVLRCVGKMTAPNILNAVSIRTATQEEIETLKRLSLICDHAVSHFLNA